MTRRFLAALGCAALLLSLSAVPVAADEEGSAGTFDVGAAPVVTTTFTPTAMDPQTNQTVTVGVQMDTGATLDELTSVTLKVWYEASPSEPTQETFDSKLATEAKTCAVITWTNGGTFVLDDDANTSWDLVLGSCVEPTLSSNTGNFVFVFKPGMVATETTGGALWQIAAATSSEYPTSFDWDDEGAAMNLFTDIAVPASIEWGTVPPGLDFDDSAPSRHALGTITVIANGGYKLNAFSENWDDGGSNTATLDAALDNAQDFALLADVDDLMDGATTLTTSALQVGSNGTITEEVGQGYSVYLWLALNDTFVSASYGGTITFTTTAD